MNRQPDFIEAGGLAFFAHRLRRLSEMLVAESGTWLGGLGVDTPPRAVSTILLLAQEGGLGVTDIAARLRLSHPLIIQLLETLKKLGLVKFGRDRRDARRRLAMLTEKGVRESKLLAKANRAMDRAYREIFDEIGSDALTAIAQIEAACGRRAFRDRLKQVQDAIAAE